MGKRNQTDAYFFVMGPHSHRRAGAFVPTFRDRAKQVLAKFALEPQWEARFTQEDPRSYGFRPGRGAWHARIQTVKYLWSPKFVVNGEIALCFNQMDHEAFLAKLQCCDALKTQIHAWLKTGLLNRHELTGKLTVEEIETLTIEGHLCGGTGKVYSTHSTVLREVGQRGE